MSSFHIDDRIEVKIEIDLAARIGEFIVKSGTVDKQIMAFGHRLAALCKDQDQDQEQEQDEGPRRWIPAPSRPMISSSRSRDERFSEKTC